MTKRVLLLIACAALAVALGASSASAGNGLCNDPFDCNGRDETAAPPKHTVKNVLNVQQAKTETRRRAAIEQSSWGYNGSVMSSFASKCHRRSPRAINCGFALYYLNNDYGPPRAQQKYCSYTAHVSIPRGSKRVTSTVELRECHAM